MGLNMAFNRAMNKHDANAVIYAAGGDKAFAELIGLTNKAGFQQRVNNWRRRGLPAQVVLNNFQVITTLQERINRKAVKATP